MATTNITKQFKSLLTKTSRFRATVLQVDDLERVKVKWGESQLWVSTSITLAINDQVVVEDTKVVSKLPSLVFARVEIP